jgi:hypothetical protein
MIDYPPKPSSSDGLLPQANVAQPKSWINGSGVGKQKKSLVETFSDTSTNVSVGTKWVVFVPIPAP